MNTSPSTLPTRDDGGAWERLERLIGGEALRRLQRAHVLVVGVGGVGSWAVEALARSGVGRLTLVDHDTVCATNLNRQLPATVQTLGLPKVAWLGDRVSAINPACEVRALQMRFAEATAEEILRSAPDVVVDAIDSVGEKALLLAKCHTAGISVVCSCGAGGRRDPTRVRVSDLAQVEGDALARAVRTRLRRAHGIVACDGLLRIPAVHSTEPAAQGYEGGTSDGEAIHRSKKPGTFCAVTGTFGFVCAAVAVELLLSRR